MLLSITTPVFNDSPQKEVFSTFQLMFNPRDDGNVQCYSQLRNFLTLVDSNLTFIIVQLFNCYQNNNQIKSRELCIRGTNQSNNTETTENN